MEAVHISVMVVTGELLQMYFFLQPSITSRHFSATPPHSQTTPTPLNPWKLGRLNHVAIVVPDLDNARRLYRDVLGGDVSEAVVRRSN